MKTGEIWRSMVDVLRADGWTFFALAAPFTVLVDVGLALFGPEPPTKIAEFTPKIVFILVLIPGLIGAIAQLAVAKLVAEPGSTPRAALATALAVLPVYLVAVFLSAVPTGIGLLLIVPGLYLLARLFLIVPVAVVERLGPLAILQRSWALTAGHGGAIMLFLVLAVLFIFGAGVLISGIGAALGSLLTVAGLKPVGLFVAALLSALASCGFSIASATAGGVVYLKLT